MRTVVLGALPPELDRVLAQRRQNGQDLFDEVWNGDYHMAPAPSGGHAYIDHQLARLLGTAAERLGLFGSGPFNLGDDATNYRVPDQGYHRVKPSGVWVATAALVVEIVSPSDESYGKDSFYAAAGVEELLIVDPLRCIVELHNLASGDLRDRSDILGMNMAELAGALDWPTPA